MEADGNLVRCHIMLTTTLVIPSGDFVEYEVQEN